MAAKQKTKKAKASAKNEKPGLFSRLGTYLKNVKSELKRVTWPTKEEVLRSSLVVVGTLIFFGLLIYLVDSAIVPVLYAFSSLGG